MNRRVWGACSTIWWQDVRGNLCRTGRYLLMSALLPDRLISIHVPGIRPLHHRAEDLQEILASCSSGRDSTVFDSERSSCVGHTYPEWGPHHTQLGWGSEGGGLAQVPQTHTLPAEIQQISLNKCFSIFFMHLGQFPETLNVVL